MADLFSLLLMPDGLPKSFFSSLSEFSVAEVKGLLTLLSGCGRWVLFRRQPVSCPKCHASPFRSIHLIECSSFWSSVDVYSFVRSAIFDNDVKRIVSKFHELMMFWSDVANFG